MRRKRDEVYLGHILEAIGKIKKYTFRQRYSYFAKNDMLFDAVVREIGIVGEASTRLSSRFKEKHNKLPIRPAVAMRNIIIHDYKDIRSEIVWKTVKEDLPKLKKQIEDILNNKDL